MARARHSILVVLLVGRLAVAFCLQVRGRRLPNIFCQLDAIVYCPYPAMLDGWMPLHRAACAYTFGRTRFFSWLVCALACNLTALRYAHTQYHLPHHVPTPHTATCHR